VLERVCRLAGREVQRLGLSATVGNPDELCGWLAGRCPGRRRVMLPPEAEAEDADVTLDFVGTLGNAAEVIARLHRGEKRLVFLDSRARAEELGSQLRELDVTTFVTHSSLSPEQRQQAEEAFASREDCVIVATSVLELGVDVGDLDRVVQIDAPPTVSSFLQRMGRTGRRADAHRNCLFLATSEDALLQSAGLIDLWADGFVEPIMPPPLPLHVFAQQLMALALQEGGIGRDTWRDWVGAMPAFRDLSPQEVSTVIDYMVAAEILWDDQGILWFGRKGEEKYGRRNFMDMLSIITSEPLFSVRHGRTDVGSVHQFSFARTADGPTTLLLGGRSWKVNYIDWLRKIAYVEPARERGRSRWMGAGRPLSFAVAHAIRHILATDAVPDRWSRRAREQMQLLRASAPWVREGSTAVVSSNGTITWWTFAGSQANAAIAAAFPRAAGRVVEHDGLSVKIDGPLATQELTTAVAAVQAREPEKLPIPVSDEAVEQLKFSACLPPDLATRLLELRLADRPALRSALVEPVRYVE